MGTLKKGLLTKTVEWAKHLRPYGRKLFWRKERAKERKLLKDLKRYGS